MYGGQGVLFALGRSLGTRLIRNPAQAMATGAGRMMGRGAQAAWQRAQGIDWARARQGAGSYLQQQRVMMGMKADFYWRNRYELGKRLPHQIKSAVMLRGRAGIKYRKYVRGPYRATLGKDVKLWGKALRGFPHIISVGMVGYQVAASDSAAEGVMRGGAEVGKLAAASVGAKIGAGVGSAILPGVGTLVGGFIGWGLGYTGMGAVFEAGFTTKSAPEFENVYMNRRALTMRQASMMELAKSSRAAFGNEAQVMHLR